MTHPYAFLPNKYVWMVCAVFVVATLGMAYILARQGKKLTTEQLPNGILEIEVPWTPQRAAEVVHSWGATLIPVARKQVYLDFVYLVLYPLALSFTCAWLAGSLTGPLSLIGIMVAWGVLLAAPLDFIENLAILQMLGGSHATPLPQIATVAATIKFTLVVGAVGYLGIGGLAALIRLVRGAS